MPSRSACPNPLGSRRCRASRSIPRRAPTRTNPSGEADVAERSEIEAGVREVLGARGKLPVGIDTVGAQDSLYDAGMTSHATVKVMLGLENRFDVEFPDELLQRSVFDQVATIADAIEKLLAEQ
ncbi:MAG: acyl carrier protein [Spirochaetaceae bacterium]|nr:acyl carrier protein [Spirochaetaceae bacterium]